MADLKDKDPVMENNIRVLNTKEMMLANNLRGLTDTFRFKVNQYQRHQHMVHNEQKRYHQLLKQLRQVYYYYSPRKRSSNFKFLSDNLIVAKALKRMLSNIVQNEVIIKDSLAFASQFKSLGANYSSFKMVSFDVASLYTNIPLDETLKIILDHSYNDETPTPPIKREDMKKLLEFATKHSHFLFNGKVYD
ncbi:unnamed protein product [Rotaria socialis]|uniref:Reverse transcriptase domain-containing protein n=1 Tax=Rotaria socialis TaxID=392032 RepID=A0A821R3M9_9BILA|nr:unnamed protein product [Rotaria socialis]